MGYGEDNVSDIKVPQSPGQTEAPRPHPEGAPALRVGARRWTLAYKQTKASSESSYMAEAEEHLIAEDKNVCEPQASPYSRETAMGA